MSGQNLEDVKVVAENERLVGVGIVFDDEATEGHVIGQLVPGSGAEACGQIKVGDTVVEVDGLNVSARPVQDLAKLFAGPPDTVVQVKVLRRVSSQAGCAGDKQERPLISFDDEKDTSAGDVEAEGEDTEEGTVIVVDVPRIHFDSNKDEFVSWITVEEPSAVEASASKHRGFFSEGAKFHGKLMSGVSGFKSQVAAIGDPLKAWGSQQVKGISDAVQGTPLFENISNKAVIVKQHTTAATSAAMQGLKSLAQADSRPDPSPKAYCMHMYTCPEHFVVMPPVEPAWPGEEAERALVVHRGTMAVRSVPLAEAAEITRGKAKMEIVGVLGIANLQCASYLVVCSSRQWAATLPQGVVYKAVDIELREIGKAGKRGPVEESKRVIEERLLAEMLDTSSLFFSYDVDVSQSQQRLERAADLAAGRPLWEQYDMRAERFIWNSEILKRLEVAGKSRIPLPVVCGFVHQISIMVPSGSAQLALIARRDWHRAGYRYLSRGVDDEGNASNFVETEQILQSGDHVTSFVVVRGSIPLLWQEAEAFVSFKPKPLMREEADAPLHLHMCSLQSVYGGLSALSLIEMSETSHEYQLSQAFAKGMAEFCRDVPFVAFDFHKVCGKLSFKNLPRLTVQCEQGLSDYGYFIARERKQLGVWRVNCVDCLDRTNVAQSVLAFRTLMHQLLSAGCIEQDHGDACLEASKHDAKMPLEWAANLHQQFKSLWADHGDTISMQYSGSQALKGDLTRTGKRTVGGLLQDGVSSIRRAVQNNFADYHRQQVMEGFHQLEPSNPQRPTSPERPDRALAAGTASPVRPRVASTEAAAANMLDFDKIPFGRPHAPEEDDVGAGGAVGKPADQGQPDVPVADLVDLS